MTPAPSWSELAANPWNWVAVLCLGCVAYALSRAVDALGRRWRRR